MSIHRISFSRRWPRAVAPGAIMLAASMALVHCGATPEAPSSDVADAGLPTAQGEGAEAPLGASAAPPPREPSTPDREPVSDASTAPAPPVADAGDACGPGAPPPGVAVVPLRFAAMPPAGQLQAAMIGGDPTGTWRITGATAYLPSAVAAVTDTTRSKGTLVGWAEFAGDRGRMHIIGEANAIVLGQAVPHREEYSGRGKLTMQAATARVTWTCPQDGGAPFEELDYGVRGSTATLLRRVNSPVGEAFLVMEAERVP